MCERFDKTRQNEFYLFEFHKNLCKSLDGLQSDLDNWIDWPNKERTHSRKYCYGTTLMAMLKDSLRLTKAKILDNRANLTVNGRIEYYRLSDEKRSDCR